jgi:hypothetical protein
MTAPAIAPRTPRGQFNQAKAATEAAALVAEVLRVRHFPLTAQLSNGIWIRPCNCGAEYRSASYAAAGKLLGGHCNERRFDAVLQVSTR